MHHGSFDECGQRSISYCRKVVFAIVVLGILIFSIYGNTFDCSWHFDDEVNITDNPNIHLKELSWKSIKRALFSGRADPSALYRPVSCLSFALNYYFGELDVLGYHLVNTLIHFLASVFLFLFIYHTLNLPSLRTKYADNAYPIALLATLLWAINPVQTQAVTYLVQRMASMAGMFYIMSMYFYLKARTHVKGGQKVLLFMLCFSCFLLALGSKENAIILPLSLSLYEILLLQKITRENLRKNLRIFLVVAGAIFILGFAYIYVRGGNIFYFIGDYDVRPFTLWQRLLTEPRVIIFYISLLFYPMPHRLNIAHSIEISTSLLEPITTLLSILLIVGAIVCTMIIARKRPLLSFCVLFFFINHLVESTIFALELIFEHRNYIPSMLLFLPVAIGFWNLLKRYSMKKSMKFIISLFIILLLIGLGHSTFMRNFTWKNEKSLWIDAVDKTPDIPRPHHNLGKYYQDIGDYKNAILEYEKALDKPENNRKDGAFVTYYNLGKIYGDLKDSKKALDFYKKSIAINPDYAPTYNNMAAIMDREGKYALAHEYLLKAFNLDPSNTEFHFNLGFHYVREGQPQNAIHHLYWLTNGKQFGDKVHFYLGIAFKQDGQLGRAVTHLRRAVKMNPRNIKPRLHLAEIFYSTGKYNQAKREAETAIGLIRDKDTLEKILDTLLKRDRSKHLNPRAAVVIPLIGEACKRRSEASEEWSDLVEEKSSQLKGIR
ncbi:MAG: tetratricopeptide repeat protein [Desulfobacteraceae bacterium]|jgi:tetratricopeptide (TPR) repeat protein